MKRNISVNVLNNCAYSMCIVVRFCIVKKRSRLKIHFFLHEVCNNYNFDYSNSNVFIYIEMNFDFEFYFNMNINIIHCNCVIVIVRY